MQINKISLVVCVALNLCFWGALASAEDKHIQEKGKTPVEIDFPSGGELRLYLCPSGVVLRGTDQNKIRVTYQTEDPVDASRVRVSLGRSSNAGRVEMSGCPRNNFRVTVEVPQKSGLYVRMFAGQLEIGNIRGDKDVELHFGQMEISMGKVSDYAHVDGSVNTGQVDAPAFDVSKGGLFRSFSKEGPGRYRLHAHVGAGQLSLTESEN